MSGETERQSRRMDGETKQADGRADRTDEQETEQPNEWTNGRLDERTEQMEQMDRRRNSRTNGQTGGWTSGQSRTEQDRADRAGQSRQSRQSRTNKQRDEAERRSRQAKQTDCRLLAPPFGRFAKHRTESCRRQKKQQSAPEKPDGSGNRERKPGADRTEVETGSRSDGSGSAKKTIRNQRTIISVCPSALTLCDARQ